MMDMTASNPLRKLHDQPDAEFAAWDTIEIVSTYGEPQAEYAAVRKSAGLIDLPQRGILELTGRDRAAFLNNLVTHQTFSKSEKSAMPAGQGVYAFLLNLKGRIVCDMNVIERGDRTLLELDTRLVDRIAKLLDAYLFSEQVKVASRLGELHELALHGPGAAALLSEISDRPIEPTAPLSSANHLLLGIESTIWRDDSAGVPGFHLIVPTVRAAELWTGLIERFGSSPDLGKRRLRPIGWAMFNTLRIEAGRPIFGIDFDGQPVESAMPNKANREAAADTGPGILSAETGQFDRAVSVTKGCYLGQEIVARMHARQQLARQIVGIRFDTDALPMAGALVYDNQQNQVGAITSSTISPLLSNHAICLGLVKKQFIAAGSEVFVPAEGQMRRGVVSKLPFVEKMS